MINVDLRRSLLNVDLPNLIGNERMLTFPKTLVDRFRHRNNHKRYGQAFYDFAKLHKVTNSQDKSFCERLYQEPDQQKARAMIVSRTDHTQ